RDADRQRSPPRRLSLRELRHGAMERLRSARLSEVRQGRHARCAGVARAGRAYLYAIEAALGAAACRRPRVRRVLRYPEGVAAREPGTAPAGVGKGEAVAGEVWNGQRPRSGAPPPDLRGANV